MSRRTGYVDPMVEDEREVKLPMWAKATIERLRTSVERARSEAEEARLLTNPDDTDTHVRMYVGKPIGLPKGERVRFQLGDRSDQYVDVRTEGNHVHVMGGDMLVLKCQASNVVNIGLD